MAVEAIITRKLNIRFIDARALETTAKLNLGIASYPNEDQKEELVNEIIRIFREDFSRSERREMRVQNADLVATKAMMDDDYSCSSSYDDTASISLSSSNRSSASSRYSVGVGGYMASPPTTPSVNKRTFIPSSKAASSSIDSLLLASPKPSYANNCQSPVPLSAEAKRDLMITKCLGNAADILRGKKKLGAA